MRKPLSALAGIILKKYVSQDYIFAFKPVGTC